MQEANRLSIATGRDTDLATIACGGSAAVKQNVAATGQNLSRSKAAATYRLSGYTGGQTNQSKADMTSKLVEAIRASDYVTTGAAVVLEGAEAGDTFTMDFSYPLVGTFDGRPISAHLAIRGTATGKSHVFDLLNPNSTTRWGSPDITCPMAQVADLLFGGGYVWNATNVTCDLSFSYKDSGESVALDGASLTVLSQNCYEGYNERIYIPKSKTEKVGVLSPAQNGHMSVSDATTAAFGETVVSTPIQPYNTPETGSYDRLGSSQFETNATQFAQSGTSFTWGTSNLETSYTAPGDTVSDTYGVTGWFAFASSPLVPVIPDEPVKTVDRKSAQPGNVVTYVVKQRMGVLGTETITTYKQMSFTDMLPDGMEYNGDLTVVNAHGADLTSQGTVSVEGNTVTFEFGDAFLQNAGNYDGRDITFRLSGTVKGSALDGSALTNEASTLFNDYYVRRTNKTETDVDNKVPIHFVDGLTGLRIADVRIPYGTMPSEPEAPAHEGYEYCGWDKEIVAAVEETTYTSRYNREMVPVTFVDGLLEQVISEDEVEWGSDAQVPDIPEHEGYASTGWDKPAINIRKPTTITVNYKPLKDVSYVVRYVEQQSRCDLAPAKIVTNATFGETVSEQAVEIEAYQLVGAAEKSITLDSYGQEIVFEYEKNLVPVHFVDGLDGSSIDDQAVQQGTAAIEPEVPVHEGYAFDGWDKPFDRIVEETTVTARYAPAKDLGYTVRYVDASGFALVPEKRVEGISLGSEIVEKAIDIDGYKLVGSSSVSEVIDGPGKEIVFVYDKVFHTVTFQLPDKTELKTERVAHHGRATAPNDPVLDGLSFAGWDCDYSDVVDDLVVTATFKETPAGTKPDKEKGDDQQSNRQDSDGNDEVSKSKTGTVPTTGNAAKETTQVTADKSAMPKTGDLTFAPIVIAFMMLSSVVAAVAWKRRRQLRNKPFNFGTGR